jgi:hypothetical protein
VLTAEFRHPSPNGGHQRKKKGPNSYKVRFGACLVCSTATPEETIKEKRKARIRTRFVLELAWFARRPPLKKQSKKKERLEFVQSSFWSLLGLLDGHLEFCIFIDICTKLYNVQSSFLGQAALL